MVCPGGRYKQAATSPSRTPLLHRPMSSIIRTLRRRFRSLIAGQALDRELDEELRSHVELETEHNIGRGMSPDDARTAALREFGGLTRTREYARDSRGVRPLEELGRDLRIGARSLRRSPAFTVVAVLTLALGIGISTAVFSLVDGVLLRPLPYPQADRLVRLYERDNSHDRMAVAGANANDIVATSRKLSAVAYYNRWPTTVLGGDRAQRVPVASVSPGFFSVLQVGALRGRLPAAEEATPEGNAVAVVSNRFWQNSLGGADIANLTLRLDGAVVPVIGVMPANFDFPAGADVWVPTLDENPYRTAHNWSMIGRLAPGATIAQVQAELDPFFQRLKASLGKDVDAEGIAVVNLHDDLAQRSRSLLVILMGAVGLVLLVACVNLASANLARGEARRQELAMRSALGAGRGRLVRLVFTEQLVVAMLGGAVGVVFAFLLTRALLVVGGTTVPSYAEVGVNGRVLLFSVAATAVAALLIGLAPAWQAGGDLRGAIAGGGDRPTARGGGSRRLRGILVGTEVALALALLVGAGLLVKSMQTLLAQDIGFRSEGVLTATVSLPPSEYRDSVQIMSYVDRTLATLRSLPGVTAAGVISPIPMGGGGGNTAFAADGGEDFMGYADYRVVDSAVFRVLGIPLREGRNFGPADNAGAPHVALVNEAFVKKFWPDGKVIGHRIRPPGMDSHGKDWLTIVGVVGDVRQSRLDAPPAPAMYVNATQRPENLLGDATFVVSSGLSLAAITANVRDVFREMDPNVPARLQPLDEMVRGSLADRRFSTLVLGTFAALALFLAAVGIYGVLAYSVARRQKEIGLRMALGAHQARVRGMVLADAMRWVLPGIVVGLVAAVALTRLLRSMLYEVSATDPIVFIAVALLLLFVAALAAWIPARRATRVSPMLALRGD